MRIVQIVRRFGPVGGLEGYAWQLTRALAVRGLNVAVVCETDESEPIDGVPVTTLGKMRPKPRWLHYLRFARRVAGQRQTHRVQNEIWHSHEMVTCAEVSTFHSTAHGAGEGCEQAGLAHVGAPRERDLDFRDETRFYGLEAPDETLTTQPRHIHHEYRAMMDDLIQNYRTGCAEARIDYALLDTATPFDTALSRYLIQRKKIG